MLARVEDMLRPDSGSWNSGEYYSRRPFSASRGVHAALFPETATGIGSVLAMASLV
jgi:hypothetical protein